MFAVAYFTVATAGKGFPSQVTMLTVGFAVQTPPSSTAEVAVRNWTDGSPSLIVTVLTFWTPRAAFTGADSVTLKVSSGSAAPSCRMVMLICWVLPLGAPAANVSVPLWAV